MSEPLHHQENETSQASSPQLAGACILVCHNKTCRKQGAPTVLKAFQDCCMPEVEVMNCGCLGKCGNGPMVLVLPDQVWYNRVVPADVSSIVAHHLGASGFRI